MRGNTKIKYGCLIVIICVLLGTAFVAANGIYLSVSNREYQGIESNTQYAENYLSNAFTYNMTLLNLIGSDYLNKDIVIDKEEILRKMEVYIHETGMSLCIVDEKGIGYDYKGEQIDLSSHLNISDMFSKREGVVHPENDFDIQETKLYLYTMVTNKNNQNSSNYFK